MGIADRLRRLLDIGIRKDNTGERRETSQDPESQIPEVPEMPPMTSSEANDVSHAMLETLLDQRDGHVEGGFYWESQIAFAYNSNKIEGGGLSEEQTRQIFETKKVTTSPGNPAQIDDIIEMGNHFRLFDFILDTYDAPLDAGYLKRCQGILKAGVGDSPGQWKTMPNGISGFITTPPDMVESEIDRLLSAYNSATHFDYRTLAVLHASFERIHPFADGNGRTGRAVLYKECLAHGLVPFIVTDAMKEEYYAGLRAFSDRGNPDKLEAAFQHAADGYYAQYANLIPSSFLLPNRDAGRQPVDALEFLEENLRERHTGSDTQEHRADKIAHARQAQAPGARKPENPCLGQNPSRRGRR